MKKFNKALNADITELKTLYIKKDKTEFKKLKAEIMQKHNISRATVFREMAKDIPGSYRQPKYSNRAPEVTQQEKELVRTLLLKKMPVSDVCNSLEKLKRQNYTWERLDRIRKAIEKDDLEAKEKAGKPVGVITIGETRGEVTPLKNESAWGDDLKALLEELLNADKMSNDAYVTVIVKGREFKVTGEIRKDILNKLANSADADGRSIMDSIDSDTKHLLKEQLRSMKSGMKFGVRDLYDIRRMYKDMGGGSNFSPIDFQLLVAVVKEFNKDAETEEIEDITFELQRKYPGCSIYIKPDEMKIRRRIYEAMTKNL